MFLALAKLLSELTGTSEKAKPDKEFFLLGAHRGFPGGGPELVGAHPSREVC